MCHVYTFAQTYCENCDEDETLTSQWGFSPDSPSNQVREFDAQSNTMTVGNRNNLVLTMTRFNTRQIESYTLSVRGQCVRAVSACTLSVYCQCVSVVVPQSY